MLAGMVFQGRRLATSNAMATATLSSIMNAGNSSKNNT
jgi:hypothetical protein